MPTKGSPPRHYKHICDYCGKEYIKKGRNPEKGALKFCSARCKFDYLKKNNQPKQCEICGKIFIPTHSRHKCCSKQCRDKLTRYKQDRVCAICGKIYHSYNQTKCCSPECQKFLRIQAIHNNIHNGCYTNLATKPTQIINNFLKENQINFINEYAVGNYSLDIFLPKYNMGIEIMGKFWHKDIRVFPDSTEYSVHKNCAEHDAQRCRYIISKGIKILYLWELDIIKNLKMCEQLVFKCLADENMPQYLHSSHYAIKDNHIECLDNSPKQFMEIQLERLNEKTP